MIFGKKNSVNIQCFTNSSKNQNNKNINTNSILMKKRNINYSGNLPIKVNLIGKNLKNINNNQSLISSAHLKKIINNNNNTKLNCSSSFHKKNCKIIIPGEEEREDGDDKKDDKQKKEINRLKELLNATKEIKKYNNLIITGDFKNKIRYNSENNENTNQEKEKEKEETKNREIKIIKSTNINDKKRKILNIGIKNYNKNINKEKIYYLIYKKNKIIENNNNDKIDKKYNKKIDNENENENNNNEDKYSKSGKKQNDANKFKIRNILSKNFIDNKSRFNTLELININNHKRKNKSPEGKTYIKTVTDFENSNKDIKNKENKNEIKSLNSNNSKDTFKINSSNNTKSTTSNITEKKKTLRNNILFYNNYFSINNNINVINNNKENDNNLNINEKYLNSPQKFNFNEAKKKTRNSLVLKFENNKSVELKNRFKSLNYLENKIDINNNKNEIMDIKFDELILYEERLNDIYIAINSFNKMEGGSMNNECLEFFKFYLDSTLNNKLSYFFSEDNYIIIQSSINLQLFIIMLIYHLSFYSIILSNSIILLIDIFSKLKHNFYLLIKQILTYYNNVNYFESKENNIYFNIIINLLKNTNIYNINNLTEEEIIVRINNNSTNISNNIHKLLNIYYEYSKNSNNNAIDYYNELLNIFNQLSIISEKDITNYFYNNVYKEDNFKVENNRYKNKIKNIFLYYQNFNTNKQYRRQSPFSHSNIDISLYHQNNTENNLYQNQRLNTFVKEINNNIIDSEQNENIIINHQNYISMNPINSNNINNASNPNIIKNNPNYLNYSAFNLNITAPFIKSPKPKNKIYTLILDLDETLVHVKQIKTKNINYNFHQKIINLRPGLFSFLNTVKPYYEIISFSSASKGYVDNILKKIETNQKYFDHNLYREHTTLYGEDYVKDISKIGRNIKKMVIVDNLDKNFRLNPDNGIKIAPYFGEISIRNEDNKLYELQKLLVLFCKLKYEDLRIAIKDYSQFIMDKITKSN